MIAVLAILIFLLIVIIGLTGCAVAAVLHYSDASENLPEPTFQDMKRAWREVRQ